MPIEQELMSVAPARKQDPGEKFPWRTLHDSGVGHWVKPAPLTEQGPMFSPGHRDAEIAALQASLREYGYGLDPNGIFDNSTYEVVTAFQRHFRPQRVDGVCDASTRKTLEDLLIHRGRPRNIAARARAFERLVAS